MNTATAVSFVEQNGTDLEKARMRWIVYGRSPDPQVTQPLAQLQDNDGAFPYKMVKGNLPTVSDTLVALWWMDDLGMLRSPRAERAAGYLLAVQKEDGGWDEDPRVAQYNPPPWASPADLRARTYLSAYSAYWLLAMGYRAHPAVQKALGFLLRYREETGRFYGYFHSTWIATAAFAMAGPAHADVVRQGLVVLMGRPPSDWADSQISWALACLTRSGLAKDHPFIGQSLAELRQRQKPDGSWTSEDGEAYAVGATIEALKVLKHYGQLEASESQAPG